MAHGLSLGSLLPSTSATQRSTSRAWLTEPLAKVFSLALRIPFKPACLCLNRSQQEEAPCLCSKRQVLM